jgi:transcriptional regulator with XRE-family HTH domain
MLLEDFLMNLAIGSTISQLRKKSNITQEQLANNIGVSAQAVSKWETDASNPDIGLLPVIAEFFGVSIDYLLGYRVNETLKDISEYLLEIKQLTIDCKYKESLQLIQEVQTFPINYELEFLKGCIKFRLAIDEKEEKNRTVFLYEAKNVFEMIIQNCSSSKYVSKAKIKLAAVFNWLKEYDTAISIANTIDNNLDTTGVISNAYIFKGDYISAIKLLQENLFGSLDRIYRLCYLLQSIHIKMNEFDKALKYIELSDAFYHVANIKSETSYWKVNINELFYLKENCFKKSAKTEDLLKVLNEHVDYAINLEKETYAEKNDVWYFDKLEPSNLKKSESQCQRLLSVLKESKKYNKLRSHPDFNDLIAKLENNIT